MNNETDSPYFACGMTMLIVVTACLIFSRIEPAHEPLKQTTETQAVKLAKSHGTNFLGEYLGMVAIRSKTVIWPSKEPTDGVTMFSSSTGEMLRWMSYSNFVEVYVMKTRKEYDSKGD